MFKDFSGQSAFMGSLAAFVGFTSAFAIVLQGLRSVGATEAQAASGLLAVCIVKGFAGIYLSLRHKMPISVAWSTPGAALLATSGFIEGGFPVAVGAFLICSVMIILTGLWKPFGRAVRFIPPAIANAMLAGILVGLCIAPVKAIAFNPWLGLPILLAWILVGRINKLFAVPAALGAFILVITFGVDMPSDSIEQLTAAIVPQYEFVMPDFTLAGFISIALPLYVVTMASQNIPGVTVLKVHGYEPEPGPLFTATGFFGALAAPFGGHAINLAAITSAMCASEDAHPDPAKRYWAAVIAAISYIVLGLLAGLVATFVNLAPSILIEAVAGLALIGAFSNAAMAAFSDIENREAAAVTFLFTASGVTFGGISGAFWGLLAGGLIYIFTHRSKADQ